MIEEVLKFTRFRICFTLMFVAASGFLSLNLFGITIIPVVLSVFLTCAGGYSYNNITDKEEDLFNRREKNRIVEDQKAMLWPVLFFSFGIIISMFLHYYSLVTSVIFTALLLSYSRFRIKKVVVVKNLYTACGLALIFIFGSVAMGRIVTELRTYCFLIALFFLIGSIISDMRDRKGDEMARIRTLPVIIGYEKTKMVVYGLISIFVFALVPVGQNFLYVLLPFTALIFLLLHMDRPSIAHLVGSISLICLPIYLVFS